MKEITLNIDGKEIKAMVSEEEIEKLTKKEEKEWPQVGDTYWFADSYGEASFAYFYKNSIYDRVRTSMGNMYRTKEEALDAVRAQKLIAAVAKRRKELNGDWVADWIDDNQKWYIRCRGGDFEISKSYTYADANAFGVYETMSIATKITEEFRDELFWYFYVYIASVN